MEGLVNCSCSFKFYHFKFNRSGPRHGPCGMPQFTFANFDVCPFTLQDCLRSCKYDLNQSSSCPRTP